MYYMFFAAFCVAGSKFGSQILWRIRIRIRFENVCSQHALVKRKPGVSRVTSGNSRSPAQQRKEEHFLFPSFIFSGLRIRVCFGRIQRKKTKGEFYQFGSGVFIIGQFRIQFFYDFGSGSGYLRPNRQS